ncbi:MAG: iron-containing alcohol dehydrogenase [Opitutales bacterium]
MKAFEFYNPTKVVFAQGAASDSVGPIAASYGNHALLVYGKQSIKKNGTYEKILKSLRSVGFGQVTEFSGVKSNPSLSHLREGIDRARSSQVDVIIAVGGGSVMDEAKGIAVGVHHAGDPWDFYSGEATPQTGLPIITVPTLPATASEMNSCSVITNDDTKEKFGFFSEHLFPKAALMDPELTLTIPLDYTAYAGVDAISHLIEGYFTGDARWTPIQDRYVEGLVKTIIETTDRIMKDPQDIEARSTMMWAATLAWNGLGVSGVGNMGFPNHMIEHPLSGRYDIAHGAGLSIVMPAWMRYVQDRYASKLTQFAREVFGLDSAAAGIDALEAWFRSIDSPTTLTEGKIPINEIPSIATDAIDLGKRWGISDYSHQDVMKILESAA